MFDGEDALPRYGLGGSFVGRRLRGGGGWDVCTTVHRPEGAQDELTVCVVRRATAQQGRDAPRVAGSQQDAAETVATAVVMGSLREIDDVADPNAQVDERHSLARQVARDEGAWSRREMIIDGDLVAGREWEHDGVWAVYHLTDEMILYVTGSVALHPDPVELKKLTEEEIGSLEDERREQEA